MKSLIVTFLCIFLSATSFLIAQDSTALEVKVEEMVSQLPRSEITSGIFYEQVPTYVPYEYFDGNNLGDSIYFSPERFSLAYQMLYYSHQDTPTDPDPSEVVDLIESHEGNEVVHLGALFYKYHKIKEEAQTNNWLDWDGTYFYDQSPSDVSLYEERTLWATSVMTEYAEGPDVSFAIDPELFFSNQTIDWNSLEVDLSDGQGWQSIGQNQVLNTSYTHLDSVYLIKLRMQDGQGSWMRAQTPLMVYTSSPKGLGFFPNEPDGVIRLGDSKKFFPSTPCCDLSGDQERLKSLCEERRIIPEHLGKNEVVKNGIEIFYWLNESTCEEACHRKPLIIVEGFDPNEAYSYNIVFKDYDGGRGLLNREYELVDILNTYVHEEGYDVYFINFGYENNTQSIKDNAEWLKMAINEINDLKADCGSVEKNVVIGASMGGLVSRWALSEMETDSIDHETELFISFDSPLKGANVPIGFQSFVKGLAGTKIFGKPLRNQLFDLKQGEWTLQTPAAKQMLIYNRFATSRRETSAQTLRTFYDEFQEQFSEKTLAIPHLALSNGSVLNEDQGFSNSEILLNKTESIPYILEALQSIWMSSVGFNSCNPISEGDQKDLKKFKRVVAFTGTNVVKMRVKMYAAPGQARLYSSGTVFEKSFLQTFLWAPIWGNYSYFAATGLQDVDNAPGATGDFNSDDSENEMFEINYDKYCFIPTASSLGVPLWPNLKKDLSDVPQVVENNPTPAVTFRGAVISNEPGSTNTNQKHISLDANSALWWRYQTEKVVFDGWETNQPFTLTEVYHIGEGPIHMPPNMDVYNFMARRCENVIKNDLTIDQNGELWIGRDANLGVVPTLGNPINEATVMKVLVSQNECDQSPTKVIVKPESAIKIGDENARGELFLSENTELSVKEDASLELKNKSKLTIGSGATVNLESMSSLTLVDSSELIVESGGILTLQESAELIASYSSKIIVETGGSIVVGSAALLKIGRFSNLIIEPGVELIIPANAELKASVRAAIEIHENSSLRIQADGILDLDLSTLLIYKGATLFLEESPSVKIDRFSKIEIYGGYVFEGDLTIDAPNGYIDIFHSTFDTRSIQGNVTLIGSQKSRRILKLRKYVRLQMNTYDLTLENGLVEIGSEFSSIRSSTANANSTFSLKNVALKGMKPLLARTDPFVFYRYGSAFGLELADLTALDVDGCTFENLTKAIVIQSGSGTHNIKDSEFIDVFIGIETSLVDRITIDQCEFSNYGVPENHSTIGIYADQTNNIHLWNSRISNFKYGIRTTDLGDWTDIDMRECSEIIGCGVGVYGYKVNFFMRNSSFFYNHFCVAGYNVFLDIPSNMGMNRFVHCVDDSGNSGYTGTGPTSPPILHEVEQDMIVAFNSDNSDLWGGHGSSGRNNENEEGGSGNRESEGETSGSGNTGMGIATEGDPNGNNDPELGASPDPPYYGPEIVLPPYIDQSQDCGLIFSIDNQMFQTNDLIPAENNYWVVDSLANGVHYFIVQFATAKFLDYEPLVILPSIPNPGDCNLPGGGANGRFSDEVTEAKVFPNPASDQIMIELPFSSSISVMNLTGQVLYQSEIKSSNHNILCASWSPGLYFLRLENGETFRIVKI